MPQLLKSRFDPSWPTLKKSLKRGAIQVQQIFASLSFFVIACLDAGGQALQQDIRQQLATVEQSVALNQAALNEYSWTEHTVISVKGEPRKRQDRLCRYGLDGRVRRAELEDGLQKRPPDRNNDELGDYMERAIALVRSYVSLSSRKMEQTFRAGDTSLVLFAPGGIQLEFKDYLKPGDRLTLIFITAAKALQKLSVNSYLDRPDDVVTLEVNFRLLPDGTNYPAVALVGAIGGQIEVTVENFNYYKFT
jgi:hypothetical protein